MEKTNPPEFKKRMMTCTVCGQDYHVSAVLDLHGRDYVCPRCTPTWLYENVANSHKGHKGISVFVKDPGRPPNPQRIKNSATAFIALIGGDFESVMFSKNICFIGADDPGGNELNFRYQGMPFFGRILIVGFDGHDYKSVNMTYADLMREFPELGVNL